MKAIGSPRAAPARLKPPPDYPNRDWPGGPKRHDTRQLSGERARHGAWCRATGLVLRRRVAGFYSAVDTAIAIGLSWSRSKPLLVTSCVTMIWVSVSTAHCAL